MATAVIGFEVLATLGKLRIIVGRLRTGEFVRASLICAYKLVTLY